MTTRPRGPAIVELDGEGGAKLRVAPRLGGRILTSVFPDGFEPAWVNESEIARGARDKKVFHNFGGQDRLWIGPEGGPHGFFFEPGAPVKGENWRVPKDLDTGEWQLQKKGPRHARVGLAAKLRNRSGVEFSIMVVRELTLLTRREVEAAIGVHVPSWLDTTGSRSRQHLLRLGGKAWGPETGMPQLWILGQFPCGPRVTVFAPLTERRRGASLDGVKPFEDRYFGAPGSSRLWEAAPPNSHRCVYFRADGALRSKFGLRAAATAGLAGAFDPDRGLLTLVKFDVHPRARYGSFLWNPAPDALWNGDAFQSYNSDDGTFFELESVSPARPSSPGISETHTHATCFLRGDPERLREFLYLTLDVTIPEIRRGA